MHGVVREASETTCLRIVFDASAKTSTGVSLNDTLLTGPSMYPFLTSILNKFRCNAVAMAADISKMFCEVGIQEVERDFHRYLVEEAGGKKDEQANFWSQDLSFRSYQSAAKDGRRLQSLSSSCRKGHRRRVLCG